MQHKKGRRNDKQKDEGKKRKQIERKHMKIATKKIKNMEKI